MPFWLQMVGTGLTTTFAVHLGAVLKEARWPAIPCINIYSHTLLKEFDVEGGHIAVPQAPGWGSNWTGTPWSGFAWKTISKRNPCDRFMKSIGLRDARRTIAAAAIAPISWLVS